MADGDGEGNAAQVQTELEALLQQQPGKSVSASRVRRIAKVVLDSRGEYKTTVHYVERFVRKAPVHCRLAGVYVIDSICRSAKQKLGDKDVFCPRFARNIEATVEALAFAPAEDRRKLNNMVLEWKRSSLFGDKTDSLKADSFQGEKSKDKSKDKSKAESQADAAPDAPAPQDAPPAPPQPTAPPPAPAFDQQYGQPSAPSGYGAPPQHMSQQQMPQQMPQQMMMPPQQPYGFAPQYGAPMGGQMGAPMGNQMGAPMGNQMGAPMGAPMYGQPQFGQQQFAPPYGAPPHGAPPHGAPPFAPPYGTPYGAPPFAQPPFDDRRGPPQQQQGGHPGACFEWRSNNSCRFGDRCKFAHDAAPPPQGGAAPGRRDGYSPRGGPPMGGPPMMQGGPPMQPMQPLMQHSSMQQPMQQQQYAAPPVSSGDYNPFEAAGDGGAGGYAGDAQEDTSYQDAYAARAARTGSLPLPPVDGDAARWTADGSAAVAADDGGNSGAVHTTDDWSEGSLQADDLLPDVDELVHDGEPSTKKQRH